MRNDITNSIDWNTHLDDISVFQVLHAAVLLILARLALIVLGFQKTAMIVNRFSRAGDPRISMDHAQVQASKHAVSLAAAFIPARILCLEQSLVLYYKLKCNRVPVALRLGVRAYPFAAHAWVELEGRPVNETPAFLKEFEPILEIG
jgi:hypothetical protein